ncbi:MAG: Ig-like domain-containing protein [Desulfamplus sp.]|nr:Ig-like domain-containing protein [Desulfamplus sp.]
MKNIKNFRNLLIIYVLFGLIFVSCFNVFAQTDREQTSFPSDSQQSYSSSPRAGMLKTKTVDEQGYTVWQTAGNSSCSYSDHDVVIEVDADPQKITELSLIVNAYDVDYATEGCSGGPEVDKVYVNGEYVGILRGATDSWSTTRFSISSSFLVEGNNIIHIDTDAPDTGCWCVGIGYASIRGRAGEFKVEEVTPKNNAVNVDWEEPNISVVFDSDVDASTVTDSNFIVQTYWGSDIFSGSFDVNGNKITFIPASNLPDTGRKIKVTLKSGINGIKSKDGGMLASDYSWTFSTMPNLNVSIVPVQVVEDVNLVHNKPAVVRVKAEWNDLSSDVTQIPAKVTIQYDGGSQFSRDFTFYHAELETAPGQYKRTGRSANFYSARGEVPIIDNPGTYSVKAIVEPSGQTLDEPKTFEAERTVGVNMYKIGYTEQTVNFRTRYVPISVGGWVAGQTQDISAMATASDAKLRSIYPIARTTPTIDTTVMQMSEPWVLKVKRILRSLAATNYLGPYNVVVGVVPAAWLSNEIQAVGVQANFVAGVTTYAVLVADTAVATIAPHEIGHVLGLEHSPATYSIVGYDTARDLYINTDVKGNRAYQFDLMDEYVASFAPGSVWITKGTYEQLQGVLTARSSRELKSSVRASSDSILVVSGEISIKNSVEAVDIESINILDNPASDSNYVTTGNYSVVLEDSLGIELESILFNPEFETGSDGNQYAQLLAVIPYNPLTAKVVIKNGAKILKSVSPSPNAPSVNIIAPVEGGSYSSQMQVVWQTSDLDSDILNTAIMFSSDDGITWDLIASNITASNYTFDTSKFSNTDTCRIKLIVNDGFNTTEKISGKFTLNNAPCVVTVQPYSNQSDVSVTDIISIIFSDLMDVSTINSQTISVKDSSWNNVSGSITYDDNLKEAVFKPNNPFSPSTTYNVTVLTGVKNTKGNSIVSDYSWSFSTGKAAIPIGVVNVSPPLNATLVPLNSFVSATFDSPFDPASINDCIAITDAAGNSIAGTISNDLTSNSVFFKPSANFSQNTVYNALIKNSVKDTSGNTLENEVKWSFMTGDTVSDGLRFTGNYSESADDTDNDGLWEQLVVNVEVEVTKSSSYNLNGRLLDSLDGEIGWSSTSNTYLNEGVHQLKLVFASDNIRSNGVAGPYKLADLQFYDAYDINNDIWLSEAFQTFPYDVTKFDSELNLTGLPDTYINYGNAKDNAFSLKDYTSHKTLPVEQISFSIDINTDTKCGVSIDSDSNIDINPDSGWSGFSDVTIKATGGGAIARDTFRITVAELDIEKPDTYKALTDNSVYTVETGHVALIYGSTADNNILLQSGSIAKVINCPGKTTVTLQSGSGLFTVSRSGAMVTFKGSDGTILKIPATKTAKSIVFNDRTFALMVSSGSVLLNSQIIGLNSASIQ